MFWKLLAERPVLGQPDQFTKGFYPSEICDQALWRCNKRFRGQALTCTRLAARAFMRAA